MDTEFKPGRKVVFGIFDNRASLEYAIDLMKQRGFQGNDISALLPTTESSEKLAHEKATKAPEGATTGAVTGAALGGGLGWLAGIGSIAIPGIGPFVAAGPILAALAGAGFGGTLGGVGGALIGMGIPEYEAKRYESSLKDGGMLLSVHVDTEDMLDSAKQVMEEAGGRDISSTTEEKTSSDKLNQQRAEMPLNP